MSRRSRLTRTGIPSVSIFDGYMRWNVLSGITLPCAPVSTLTRSVAGVSGLSFSVILRVAYTSSLSSGVEWTPPRWRSSRLVLRLDLARDLGRPEECGRMMTSTFCARRCLLSTSAWLMCSPRPADVTDAASVS